VQGQPYYVRVFAYNSIGYGPMVDSGATTYHPMVEPGLPTSVSLTVLSGASLRVFWHPPLDNGGDTVTKYRVEWDTTSLFSTLSYFDVENLASGAPYHYSIPGLVKGTTYYVRVKAFNAQGFGSSQTTTPASEHPRELSSPASNVRVGITSGRFNDSKVTVAYGLPVDNGGDAITSFRVSWDIVPELDSFESLPTKGFADVPVTQAYSYTISNLEPGRRYYIQVEAENLVGRKPLTQSISVTPSLQPPGKPSSASVNTTTSCASASCALVQWNYPRVPFHGLFCGGGGTNAPSTPELCPWTMGEAQQADGGAPISKYIIQWSIASDFSVTTPPHYGEVEIPVTSLSGGEPYSYTITDLTAGREYFVRIAAVNSEGMSLFTTQDGLLATGTSLTVTPV
jgi:hypothetical protein